MQLYHKCCILSLETSHDQLDCYLQPQSKWRSHARHIFLTITSHSWPDRTRAFRWKWPYARILLDFYGETNIDRLTVSDIFNRGGGHHSHRQPLRWGLNSIDWLIEGNTWSHNFCLRPLNCELQVVVLTLQAPSLHSIDQVRASEDYGWTRYSATCRHSYSTAHL